MTNPSRTTGLLTLAIFACAVANLCAAVPTAPRDSVARIVVQEQDGTAFGSGALVDVRGEFGLVVTNWHVVREATGPIEVLFPSGFRSEARRLKLDEDWDLAALVIWRPPVEPIPLATSAPRRGDPLTICGYGHGQYREATGRCTDYYAPDLGLPHELVELDVEARQGDSGGPILNERGEIAGVLFGAGQGTTLGSFGGRVGEFLASLTPRAPPTPASQAPSLTTPSGQSPAVVESPVAGLVAVDRSPPPASLPPPPPAEFPATRPAAVASIDQPAPWRADLAGPAIGVSQQPTDPAKLTTPELFEDWNADTPQRVQSRAPSPVVASMPSEEVLISPPEWFDGAKSIFALVGVAFVLLQLVRLVT